ncbi:MAG TPA: PilZ domain-containing protein [Desulfomonilia bacterium]|nr:PilZ domain-containing protein [Desulfomonilia bacterium]
MHSKKEKRLHERIPFPELKGSVEISETIKPIAVINASAEGVCITGVHIPVGSVVRLAIDDLHNVGDISLYCKVVWASEETEKEKCSGLSFLNTNKVLFKKDLVSFNRLLELMQDQDQP